MLLPTVALVLATPTQQLPTIRFEYALDDGASAALVVEHRGDELEIRVEATYPPDVPRADLSPALGEWSLADGVEELLGEAVGPLTLERVGRTVRGEPLHLVSAPLTIDLEGFDPTEFACAFSLAGAVHDERARFDGLAPGARLVGWTEFAHGEAWARASFYEGESGRAVHLRLTNPGTRALFAIGKFQTLVHSTVRYSGDVDDTVRSTRPEEATEEGDGVAEWSLAPGSVQVSVFCVDVEPDAELESWSVTIDAAEIAAELAGEPRRARRTYRWERTTGVAVSAPIPASED